MKIFKIMYMMLFNLVDVHDASYSIVLYKKRYKGKFNMLYIN